MNETEQQNAVDQLIEDWEVVRPIVAELQRRTGLSRVESMLPWLASMDGEEPEPWQQTT